MLVNILIFIVAGAFSVYVLYSACRKYIGHNPQAQSLWSRVKAWWPGFVKRHIVDDDPYQDESHAATRYAEACNLHNSPPEYHKGIRLGSCPHCGATPYIMETSATGPYPSSDIAVCAHCKRPK